MSVIDHSTPAWRDARLLNDRQAASLLGMAVKTLRHWRNRDEGPPYVRIGRSIRYRPQDLTRWLESRLVEPRGMR